MTPIPRDYAPPKDLLAEHVILVTGAGDGLGRAAALAYAAHGATVILLGRSPKKLERVYDEIETAGRPAPLLLPADLAACPPAEFERIAGEIQSQFGRLDGLLHSAAHLGPLAPLEHYDLGEWVKVMQVNLNAAFLLTRACLPALRAAPAASVIFTTAEVARHGRAYWGAYALAGAALENLARIWADELTENTRIRVNTLDPGAVRTSLRARAYPGENPQTLATPESVMGIYLWLMGSDSAAVTGRALSAQGSSSL